ncbi:hypothetical protein QS257_01955 [Terrilactibacillus sp. S3-3]|nr:hypothetical protein QS257_01955 [Terrilactibacillus sp. S3-3]
MKKIDPSKGWANGYHFGLFQYSKKKKNPIVSVTGWNKKHNGLTKLYFNAKTGAYMPTIKGGKSMKKILFICIPFFIFILFYPGTNVHATTHSHTNQDVTAYISTNSTYFGTRAVPYKTVAVHPKKKTLFC